MSNDAKNLLPTYHQFYETPIRGKRTVVNITFLPRLSLSGQVNITFPKLAPNMCVNPDSIFPSALFENTNTKSWFKNNLGRLLCKELQMRIGSSTVYDNKLENMIMVYKDFWLPDERREDIANIGSQPRIFENLCLEMTALAQMLRMVIVLLRRLERG